MEDKSILNGYETARELYGSLGVDTEEAIKRLSMIEISLHCWQGDDVGGFEFEDTTLGGGLAVTGNYPGKARTADELRADLDMAYKLIPGRHRLNLHAIYAESGSRRVERNELAPEHYSGWVDWARMNHHGVDFNPSCFSHPLADAGFTLSSSDEAIRRFWVEHCIVSRRIGEHFGRELGTPAVTNIWIPDGYKDTPFNRKAPRDRLLESLDTIFAQEIDPKYNLDAVESKLFGIGSESYVVGSHEFYLGYAITRGKLLCLDSGHFHPTESIGDKLSAVFTYLDEVLLHVSRGVRWDSDHVVILNDDTRGIMQEVVRNDFLERTHIGLDFFDASINRVAAWVVGTRSTLKALLLALLEPRELLEKYERSDNFTYRLALQERIKSLPFGAVWDYYCLSKDVAVGISYMDDIQRYEQLILKKRS